MRSPDRLAPPFEAARPSVSSAGRPEPVGNLSSRIRPSAKVFSLQATDWLPPRPTDDHATLSSRPRGNSHNERRPRVVCCIIMRSVRVLMSTVESIWARASIAVCSPCRQRSCLDDERRGGANTQLEQRGQSTRADPQAPRTTSADRA